MNRNNLPIAPDLTKTTERFTATIPKFNKNGSYARARMRGAILSPIGWQRFQTAKQQAELEEIWEKHFTQENLSARTALSINTLSRIFKREQGVDRQSLEYLFQAFGLELTTADFTSPTASWEELLSQRSNPQQAWDNAVDTSVFYGHERELAQLWQWIVSTRCRVWRYWEWRVLAKVHSLLKQRCKCRQNLRLWCGGVSPMRHLWTNSYQVC